MTLFRARQWNLRGDHASVVIQNPPADFVRYNGSTRGPYAQAAAAYLLFIVADAGLQVRLTPGSIAAHLKNKK